MRRWVTLLIVPLFSLVSCGADDPSPGAENADGSEGGEELLEEVPGGLPDPGALSLTAHLQVLRRAQIADDVARAAIIVKGLIPDQARIATALRGNAPDGTAVRIATWLDASTARLVDDANWSGLLSAPKPRREVTVHAATGEAIVANTPGTAAHREFPGGARDVAETLLRPDKTFYEVEFTEPGKSRGTKFHLFFWDGRRWTMLGPVWRMR